MLKRDIITGRTELVQRFLNLIPKSIRLRLNPRRYAIETFVFKSSQKLPQNSRILDAGAGPCPYKNMFSHCKYEATDFSNPNKMLNFVCTLDNIPQKDNSYDAVLCTEVLEHVEYPQKVINELYRVLKKGGKLLLTTPQQFMVHQKPYNFYYFTKYGLASLLADAGFKKFKITPQGGYFWALGDIIRHNGLSQQYKNIPLIYYLIKVIAYPFTQIILPFILFHLDFIDKSKDWTMGYTLEAVK